MLHLHIYFLIEGPTNDLDPWLVQDTWLVLKTWFYLNTWLWSPIVCLLVIMLPCYRMLPFVWLIGPGSKPVSSHARHHLWSANWCQLSVLGMRIWFGNCSFAIQGTWVWNVITECHYPDTSLYMFLNDLDPGMQWRRVREDIRYVGRREYDATCSLSLVLLGEIVTCHAVTVGHICSTLPSTSTGL